MNLSPAVAAVIRAAEAQVVAHPTIGPALAPAPDPYGHLSPGVAKIVRRVNKNLAWPPPPQSKKCPECGARAGPMFRPLSPPGVDYVIPTDAPRSHLTTGPPTSPVA